MYYWAGAAIYACCLLTRIPRVARSGFVFVEVGVGLLFLALAAYRAAWRWATEHRLSASVEHLADPEGAGAVVDVLRFGGRVARAAAIRKLNELLPTLRNRAAATVDADKCLALLRATAPTAPEAPSRAERDAFTISVIDFMGSVEHAGALPTIQRFTTVASSPAVREGAKRCQARLQAVAADAERSGTLLRPAEAPTGETLLRPAEPVTDAVLLRAVDGEAE